MKKFKVELMFNAIYKANGVVEAEDLQKAMEMVKEVANEGVETLMLECPQRVMDIEMLGIESGLKNITEDK